MRIRTRARTRDENAKTARVPRKGSPFLRESAKERFPNRRERASTWGGGIEKRGTCKTGKATGRTICTNITLNRHLRFAKHAAIIISTQKKRTPLRVFSENAYLWNAVRVRHSQPASLLLSEKGTDRPPGRHISTLHSSHNRTLSRQQQIKSIISHTVLPQ